MLLEKILSLNAPSGHEDAVRSFIKNRIKDIPYTIDSMGNLTAHRKGSGMRVMLCAHMDEVGFIISEITEKGLLRFKTVGGIESTVLSSKKVVIGDSNIIGVTTAKAVHLQGRDEREKMLKTSDIYIDIGADTKEAAQKVVSVGDYGTFFSVPTEFGEGLLMSKALDDRVGCAILLELIQNEYDLDLYFAFTSQEEVGIRGSRTAAAQIAPEAAIIIEGTICSDVFGTKEHQTVTHLGAGAALTAMDGAAMADISLLELIKKAAQENSIAYQMKHTTMGGTDAGSIQRSGTGVRTAVISVPCRYIHSGVSVMSKNDFKSVLALTDAALRKLERSAL
ncbi:MAG: M20/M25/M40 family metallo-hydrolase [Clostridia bacterium]|nr:M20/M25/M40 family metallo-hydrolase [Clostridia bacterium]